MSSPIVIGVLALQGAFVEHVNALRQLGVTVVEVREVKDLDCVDGLIIPGGESTTIVSLAERWGLMKPLTDWVRHDRPVFGTCAGLILLADRITASSQKVGGQSTVGGIDVTVQRNFYGTQSGSFQTEIQADVLANIHPQQTNNAGFLGATAPAVFIRAPGIVQTNNDKVQILATVSRSRATYDNAYALDDSETHPCAVRQGNLMATTFHPELTRDLRWHQLFVNNVTQWKHNAAEKQDGVKAT